MISGKLHRNFFILASIVIVGFAIRLRLSQDQKLHQWDEKFHALVAKNCMAEPLHPKLYKVDILDYDFRKWYRNYTWVHKQPVPLWLIACSYRIAGLSEFSTRLPSLILSTLMIMLCYLIARNLYDAKTGLMAAFFMAVNGLVIELGAGRVATDHYDLIFCAFILIAVYCAERNAGTGKLYFALASGALIGLAIMTKWLPALIVFPIHFLLLKHQGVDLRRSLKFLLVSMTTALLLALPWQLFILANFPQEARWEYLHQWMHVTTPLEGHKDAGPLYYLNQIRINYSEIIYLVLIFLIWKVSFRNAHRLKYLALLAWVFVPLLFFSFVRTKMQGYILFVSPALFILTADFFFFIKNRVSTKQEKMWIRSIAGLILGLVILLPLRYCFERTSFGFEESEKFDEREKYLLLIGQLPENTLVLNVEKPIEFMFYTDYLATENKSLNEAELNRLRQKNYNLAIVEKGKLILLETAAIRH